MFSRTLIVLFVTVLSISWGQAQTVQMHHDNYESLYPAILDFHHEYMGPRDEMGTLPASYENLVRELYNYLVNPKEKFIRALSSTSFVYEQYDESDEMKFWKNISVEDVLKMPNMRRRFVFNVTQAALNRLAESCEELEKTISPLINNGSAPLENASGLNTKEKQQLNMKVIRLEVKSEKLVLQDLQNRLNFYREHVLFATNFEKNIGGLSLQGLLRYSVSLMRTVQGSWIDWKMMSHYSNVAEA